MYLKIEQYFLLDMVTGVLLRQLTILHKLFVCFTKNVVKKDSGQRQMKTQQKLFPDILLLNF